MKLAKCVISSGFIGGIAIIMASLVTASYHLVKFTELMVLVGLILVSLALGAGFVVHLKSHIRPKNVSKNSSIAASSSVNVLSGFLEILFYIFY